MKIKTNINDIKKIRFLLYIIKYIFMSFFNIKDFYNFK